MGSKNLDGVLIKKANTTQKWTEKDIQDLMACQDPETGPQYFLKNFFYIQHATKGQIKYQAFDYQDELLESYHKHRYSVNMLGRQMGKTTTAVGYLLWYAMFVPDSTILIAAHKYTGAQEIMQRLRYAYETCPDWIRAGVTSYNKQSIEFENGSRIVAQTTTETTGRGMSISLLYLDEFAYVEPNIATEFWTSIAPTLATGGKAIITSTPNSDEDQFAQIWNEANKRLDEYGNATELGKNGYYPYTAIWSQHPDRDEAWADEMRSQLGQARFEREHECKFLIFDETLISSLCLATLEGEEPKMKMGQARWYKKINPTSTYIVALDPSLGTGGDPAAIQIIEVPSMDQVAEWHHNLTPVQAQVRIMRDMLTHIDEKCKNAGITPSIYYSVENNTLGESALMAIEALGEETFPGLFLSEPVKRGHVRRFRRGFNTTHTSKIAACAKLKQLIETRKLKVRSKALISELKTYVGEGVTFKAKTGQNDDLVSSLLLAIRMVITLQDWDPLVYDKMRDQTGLEEHDLPMPIYISTY
jgi:Terminase large subunit, T4likevirus-type, N-terminal/Terminase RNaseH-like domain